MIKYWLDIIINWFTFPSSINWIPIKLWKANDPKKPAWRYINSEKTIYLFPEFLKIKPAKYLIEKVLLHEFSHFLQHNYFDKRDINLVQYLFNHNMWSFNDYSLTNRKEYTSEYFAYGEAFISKGITLPKHIKWIARDDVIYHYIKHMNDFAIMKYEDEIKI